MCFQSLEKWMRSTKRQRWHPGAHTSGTCSRCCQKLAVAAIPMETHRPHMLVPTVALVKSEGADGDQMFATQELSDDLKAWIFLHNAVQRSLAKRPVSGTMGQDPANSFKLLQREVHPDKHSASVIATLAFQHLMQYRQLFMTTGDLRGMDNLFKEMFLKRDKRRVPEMTATVPEQNDRANVGTSLAPCPTAARHGTHADLEAAGPGKKRPRLWRANLLSGTFCVGTM